MRFVFALATVMVLGVGCGGPGSVDGDILGQTLTVKSSALVEQTYNGGSYQFLILADVDEICSFVKANRYPKNGKLLFIVLANLERGEQRPLEKGDYTFGFPPRDATGLYGSAQFSPMNENCESPIATERLGASSGFATVESVEVGKHISGSFDATFESRVTGTFNADWCLSAVSSTARTCE